MTSESFRATGREGREGQGHFPSLGDEICMLGIEKSYEAEGFQDRENTRYDALMVAACRQPFV